MKKPTFPALGPSPPAISRAYFSIRYPFTLAQGNPSGIFMVVTVGNRSLGFGQYNSRPILASPSWSSFAICACWAHLCSEKNFNNCGLVQFICAKSKYFSCSRLKWAVSVDNLPHFQFRGFYRRLLRADCLRRHAKWVDPCQGLVHGENLSL